MYSHPMEVDEEWDPWCRPWVGGGGRTDMVTNQQDGETLTWDTMGDSAGRLKRSPTVLDNDQNGSMEQVHSNSEMDRGRLTHNTMTMI